jgi:hypothetical protein
VDIITSSNHSALKLPAGLAAAAGMVLTVIVQNAIITTVDRDLFSEVNKIANSTVNSTTSSQRQKV